MEFALLHPQLSSRVDRIRSDYTSADPFPHVCVDNFLSEGFAEQLLQDFPPFDDRRAVNEFGIVGPKCVITDIAGISPAYRQLHQYLGSSEFLQAVTDMTGIPDLRFDPFMYGGGTHENRPGAELDPHIDFNYDHRTGFHRRLNLLIYLNKDWSTDWGGAIELHSDPQGWFDGSNRVKAFNCEFNRCVIFETSERSWHGFKKIVLPSDKAGHTRRLISIYLYTPTRPADEIVGPHGTFYLPYGIPEDVKPGHVLTNEQYDEIARLMRKRDSLLSLSFQTEKRLSDQATDAARMLETLREHVRPSTSGSVTLKKGAVSGYFPDAWAASNFSCRLTAVQPIHKLQITGWLPPGDYRNVRLTAFGESTNHRIGNEMFTIEVAPKEPITGDFEITAETTLTTSSVIDSTDKRSLGFIVNSLVGL